MVLYNPKIAIIERTLTFSENYIALPDAIFGTLGGDGLELRVWLRRGIKRESGIMVEHSRNKSVKLIGQLPYRYYRQLATFPSLYRSTYPGRGVDSFHLDLCGEFETRENLASFLPVLPLVVSESKGRCLAVTVSDQRRNTTLERWGEVFEFGKELLGSETAEKFVSFLEAEQKNIPFQHEAGAFFQPSDPVKGAKKEFGLAVNLLELILLNRREGYEFLPDVMERYVYRSRSSGKPCRMRTYMFHFSPVRCSTQKEASAKFIRTWGQSILRAVMADGDVLDVPKPELQIFFHKERSMSIAREQFPKLLALTAISEEFKAEFERLFELAEQATKHNDRLSTLRDTILKVLSEAEFGAEVSVPPSIPQVQKPAEDKPAPEGRPEVLTFRHSDPQVAVMLNLLVAKGEGLAAFEAARKVAMKELGLSSRKKEDRNRFRGMLAQLSGRLRGKFVRRVLNGTKDMERMERAMELATLFTKTEGQSVMSSDLLLEADEAAERANDHVKKHLTPAKKARAK